MMIYAFDKKVTYQKMKKYFYAMALILMGISWYVKLTDSPQNLQV